MLQNGLCIIPAPHFPEYFSGSCVLDFLLMNFLKMYLKTSGLGQAHASVGTRADLTPT